MFGNVFDVGAKAFELFIFLFEYGVNAAPRSVTSSTMINSMPGQLALNFSRNETVISPFTVSSHLVGLIISPSFLALSGSFFKSCKKILQLSPADMSSM